MDLPSLIIILGGTRSYNPHEREAAEAILNQFQYTPHHLVRILQIIVDDRCDKAVRQAASIHFKNFIARNWTPRDPGEQCKILPSDKDVVRQNILNFVASVPNLVRVQLGECLKTMVLADYPEQWPLLLHWIKHNLLGDQVYSSLFVLMILTGKYEFKSNEERIPLYHIVEETFPNLLNIFKKLVQIANPSIEVADLMKLVCKIFRSSIFFEIPRQLLDLNVFDDWMVLFFNILERSVPYEGQPVDPELRKSWGWWKVKKLTVQIVDNFFTRVDHPEFQNPDTRAFAQKFQRTYARKILECHLNMLDIIRDGDYLPDRVTMLIFQCLSISISKNNLYSLLRPRLDVVLFEIIFPLLCFSDNDQRIWEEDPHEYLRKENDITECLYNSRTSAIKFLMELVWERGEENLHKFILFIVGILNRYDETGRQKDGALFAIGALCGILRHTEPYKSGLEQMLVKHVFPEFGNPKGHLRAKAAWVSGLYADINFSDPNNFLEGLHKVIKGMTDTELPVRVNSVVAVRFFIKACKDLGEIRPILHMILGDIFNLFDEVENEDLVSTLETIVGKFGEEIAPYALELCQKLALAFWNYIKTAEADEEGENPAALSAAFCLRAISRILVSVRSLPGHFVDIKPTLLPIMHRMLSFGGEEVFEEVLEIVSYMTSFSPQISLDMWSLWPLMMESLADWAICFFPNILVPLNNYISRSTEHFLTCKEPDYQQSLWNMISFIMGNKNLGDVDIEPAAKLIQVVFQNCRGKVDHWVKPYIRISVERLKRAEKPYLKCLLIEVVADALYYNPLLTLNILDKLGVATDIFNLWFQMLQQTEKNGHRANFRREHDKKVCCLGLTSLLPLPADQVPMVVLEHIFLATLDLLVAYKDQVAEAKRQEAKDGDMNGLAIDVTDEEMGDITVQGDEADSTRFNRLDVQEKAFLQPDDDEELRSPIDDVDPFIFFLDTIKALQTSNPSRLHSLSQTLNLQYRTIVDDIVKHAEQRRIEFEVEKMEKAS